jgi:hypothetical protein
MYGRTITLTLKNPSDGVERLKDFANTIVNNPMYDIIISRIKESAGFLLKTHAMVESANGVKLISQIMFENKEQFGLYADLESNRSVWDMFLSFADDAGIKLEAIDDELTVERFYNYHISNL